MNYPDDFMNKIICGDCLKILKEIPDNSIDAVITDPPYGLSNHKTDKVIKTLQEWLSGNDGFVPKGKGFMGKEWDAFVPPPAVWRECLRVLKCGGHILVFAGTRSIDLMGISLRLAGFEIRDMIGWVYGSGFAKSLNIGKAIDKLKRAEREITGYDQKFGRCDSGIYQMNVNNQPKMKFVRKDKPATEEAKQWEGWGTALKPSIEPIILARKPLEKGLSVAENVLKWGTGGINIDECRIPINNEGNVIIHNAPSGTFAGGEPNRGSYKDYKENTLGRFPANFIVDGSEEIEGLFPKTKSSSGYKKSVNGDLKSWVYSGGCKPQPDRLCGYDDEGSSSRFFYHAEFTEEDYQPIFYCAKAGRKERDMGCEELEGSKGLNFGGRLSGAGKPINIGIRHNNHPTVKPIKLIEYLIKLITKEDMIVLDPFLGSGTTAIACKRLNRYFIGVEVNEEYYNIAKARLDKGMI